MATNQYERQRREQERILSGLERRYDKIGSPTRRFTQDCANIEKLVADKVIDRSHADLLIERAQGAYAEAQMKHKLSLIPAKAAALASKQVKWGALVLAIMVLVMGIILKTVFIKLFG